MSNRIVIPSLSEIDAAADEFLRRIGEHRLIAFHASMGAGKTTFITALCRRLGVRSDAVSRYRSVRLSGQRRPLPHGMAGEHRGSAA